MIQLLAVDIFYNPFPKNLLKSSDEEDGAPDCSNEPVGINETCPEANKRSSKTR